MHSIPPATDPHLNTPLWRNTSFQLMWTSVAASGFGDRMIELAAIPMLITAGAQADVGPATAAVYFWFFLPWIFITPIGGWLADTLPRKWLLLACDEGRALLLLIAVLMVPAGLKASDPGIHLHPDHHWKIFAILFGVGALASIFSPTRNALIPQLVPPSKLNSANSVLVGIGVIASLIGYKGGVILEEHSVRRGIEVALLAYAITGLMFAFMKPRPHVGLETDKHLSQWTRFIRASKYIRTHRPVRQLVLLYTLIWSMAMVIAPALGSLCLIRYGFDSSNFMTPFIYMNMAMGVGMLAAGVILSVLNLRRGANKLMLYAMLACGVVVGLLAVQPSVYVAVGLCFLLGTFGGLCMINISTITQRITPNYILGRVCGVREMLSNFISVLVNLAIWKLPHWQKFNPDIPNADKILVWALYPLAVLMIFVGWWSLRNIRRK